MAHVLVIDDDPPVRRLVADILKIAGHTVTLASDGLEGAQLYREKPADVVLCDIVMRHSGLALIRILHEQYPDCRIIAMSGVDPIRLEYARGSGAMCTLKKPFTPQELVDLIANVLATPTETKPSKDETKS
jgi:DNA-binding NtrC family response regulator